MEKDGIPLPPGLWDTIHAPEVTALLEAAKGAEEALADIGEEVHMMKLHYAITALEKLRAK